MNNRNIIVTKKLKTVKVMHVLMMIGWPILLVISMIADSYLFQNMDTYSPFAVLLIFIWLLYTYYMVAILRNFNLQTIASEDCDFETYLEALLYVEKFFVFKKSRYGQRVGRTDGYILKGDFDGAYQHLMSLKPYYNSLTSRSRMLYDYYWCVFYAELGDSKNYRICLNVFQNNWIWNTANSKSIQRQASRLFEQLFVQGLIFEGKNEKAKECLSTLYRSGKLSTKYEFIKYCYYMGVVDYNIQNLMYAKHWFAQVVSFGLSEHMSKKAQKFLDKLEEMQISYSPLPPAQNQYYFRTRNLKTGSIFLSILMGLLFISLFIWM